MKNLRLFLPLFLLLTIMLGSRPSRAAVDTIYVHAECGTSFLWDFSFKHSGPSTLPVTRIVFTIDTLAHPYARFVYNDVVGLASQQGSWTFTGVSPNGDSAYWIDEAVHIFPGTKDSIFRFQFDNSNATLLYDSSIEINWQAFFSTQTTPVSGGTFIIIPTAFQDQCKLDTVTQTSTTGPCDPIFNFTVCNRNSGSIPIDGFSVESVNPFAATMRPTEMTPPTGWKVDSVTQQQVFFSGNGASINHLQCLSNFLVGLRANPVVDTFTFVWRAYSGGVLIDRDTILKAYGQPNPCSNAPNSDSASIRSDGGACGFDVLMRNIHSGQGSQTISRISKVVLTINTAGVTFKTAKLPNEASPFSWSYSGLNTQQLTWITPSLNTAQPSPLTWTYPFTIDNPNVNQPVSIGWQTFAGSTAVSTGSLTANCQTGVRLPDTVVFKPSTLCMDTIIVKNRHTNPTSGVQAISLQLATTGWTFATTQGSYTIPANWQVSTGNGLYFFNQGNSSNDLASGANDTLIFNVVPPKNATATYTLHVQTFERTTSSVLVDTQITTASCTPPVVCDSVAHSPNAQSCEDTLTIFNRRRSENIDSIVVTPQDGWIIRSATALAGLPWHANFTPTRATFSEGNISPNTSQGGFIVAFNDGPAHTFSAKVQTFAGKDTCTTVLPESCTSLGVDPINPESLAFSVAPNPFGSRSDITFTTTDFARVDLVLVDVLGRAVQPVFAGMMGSGDHTFTLDGSTLPAGTYYLRLEANGTRMTKKLVIQH